MLNVLKSHNLFYSFVGANAIMFLHLPKFEMGYDYINEMGHVWLGLRSKSTELKSSLVKSCKRHTSDLNFAVQKKQRA